MGFDPRRWRPAATARTVTANLDALLAENQELRRELSQLREEIGRLRRSPQRDRPPFRSYGVPHEADAAQGSSRRRPGPAADVRQGTAGYGARGAPQAERVSRGPALTAGMVQGWIEAMARHPAWEELRVGPPAGLRGLVERLRSRSWNPALSLEQELDRRQSGLGSELSAALRGPHSRGRWAVRAAFALYGPSAIEWLSDEPLRVVAELLRLVQRLEGPAAQAPPAGRSGPQGGRRPGTRTANTSWASQERTTAAAGGGAEARAQGRSRQASGQASGQGPAAEGQGQREAGSGRGSAQGRQNSSGDPGASTPRGASEGGRREALALLGLQPGASLQAIKRAYRTLAKQHHPDLGGDASAFQRLDAAYRLLLER